MDKKRIMIVEDEAVTAMDLKSNLIQLGYDVPAVASNGEEALRKASEVRPDLVLMDITLTGGMNGIQIADEIRKIHAIPVVFLTAHADAETIGRAKTTEPFGYLPQTFAAWKPSSSTIEVALYKGEADAQRRKAEARLKWVMDEQKIILDNIGSGVLFTIYRKIIWASKSLSNMFGYSLEATENRDTEMFYADKKSYNEIGREGYAALSRGEIYTTEMQMKKKDGSLIWCHLIGQAVNPGNPDDGSIWLLEDVTQRRQLEEALQKSEEKYRTVANFTHDWEFWIGPDESIIYSSPSCEKVTGYAAAAFEKDASLLRSIIHPDDAAMYDEHRHEARAHHEAAESGVPDHLCRWIDTMDIPCLSADP